MIFQNLPGYCHIIPTWLLKEPNKTRLRARLSKIAPRTLIGQKVNKGNSCCASVSSEQKSKHRHADNTCHRNSTKKFAKLSDKLHKTEVKWVKKSINKLKKLKRQHLKSIGNLSALEQFSMNERPTWPASEIKVRKETDVPYLKFGKNTQHKISTIRKSFVGSKMVRTHKRPNNDDESDEEKPKERGHKDLKTRAKKSRSKKDEKDENEDKRSRENRHKV